MRHVTTPDPAVPAARSRRAREFVGLVLALVGWLLVGAGLWAINPLLVVPLLGVLLIAGGLLLTIDRTEP